MDRWLDSTADTTARTGGGAGIGVRTNTRIKHNTMEATRMRTLTIALAMVAMVAMAAVGPAYAAPGSIDGSQTDTNTEVYISADKTMDADFNASGDTTWNLTLQNVPDSADLAMNVSHEGTDYYEFSGDFNSYDDGDSDADATTNGYYHTFTDDELSTVPMGINENATLNVTYWNASADNPSPTTEQVYVENNEERSVQRVTDNSAFADVETVEPSLLKADDGESHSEVEIDDSVEVNGSATDVTYVLADENTSTPFGNVTEDISDSGTFTLMQAEVDADESGYVPVFYNSAPDWYDAGDMGTYAVYDSGDDTITYNTADAEFDGETTGDFMADSRSFGLTDAWTVYNLAGGYSNDGLSAAADLVM